jgi:hypothetical protein
LTNSPICVIIKIQKRKEMIQMRYEVYAKKINGGKWNHVGESNNKYDAIEMGANCGVNGYFAVYDTEDEKWVDLGF